MTSKLREILVHNNLINLYVLNWRRANIYSISLAGVCCIRFDSDKLIAVDVVQFSKLSKRFRQSSEYFKKKKVKNISII